MKSFVDCKFENLTADDQARKKIIDQLNSEGIELLMPIVFESSDESAEECKFFEKVTMLTTSIFLAL
jgi:hypothetical protein